MATIPRGEKRNTIVTLEQATPTFYTNHTKCLVVTSQHYKEKYGETAYSLVNVDTAAT